MRIVIYNCLLGLLGLAGLFSLLVTLLVGCAIIPFLLLIRRSLAENDASPLTAWACEMPGLSSSTTAARRRASPRPARRSS